MSLFDLVQVIVTAGAVTVGTLCTTRKLYALALVNGIVVLVQIGLFVVRHHG